MSGGRLNPKHGSRTQLGRAWTDGGRSGAVRAGPAGLQGVHLSYCGRWGAVGRATAKQQALMRTCNVDKRRITPCRALWLAHKPPHARSSGWYISRHASRNPSLRALSLSSPCSQALPARVQGCTSTVAPPRQPVFVRTPVRPVI